MFWNQQDMSGRWLPWGVSTYCSQDPMCPNFPGVRGSLDTRNSGHRGPCPCRQPCPAPCLPTPGAVHLWDALPAGGFAQLSAQPQVRARPGKVAGGREEPSRDRKLNSTMERHREDCQFIRFCHPWAVEGKDGLTVPPTAPPRGHKIHTDAADVEPKGQEGEEYTLQSSASSLNDIWERRGNRGCLLTIKVTGAEPRMTPLRPVPVRAGMGRGGEGGEGWARFSATELGRQWACGRWPWNAGGEMRGPCSLY